MATSEPFTWALAEPGSLRARLFDAALGLIDDGGIEAVSFERLAKDVGVRSF